MKTPEEIKKGLDCCQTVVRCDGCTYKDIGNIVAECTAALCGDALAYIQKLESDNETLKGSLEMWKSVASSPGAVEDMARENYRLTERLAQVERERDAAVSDLETVIGLSAIVNLDCEFCKYEDRPACEECDWQWRGVCPENSKEEDR